MASTDKLSTEYVVILSTDIRGFTELTSLLEDDALMEFTNGYYRILEEIASRSDCLAQDFNPHSGDAATMIFTGPDSGNNSRYNRAIRAGIRIVLETLSKRIPRTRIGLFGGSIKRSGNQSGGAKFGNSFSASNRLEQLCGFFGVDILMDRDVAYAQEIEKNIVSIGKITPKGFQHPIHVYSLYSPDMFDWSDNVDQEKLSDFIALKNEAMEYFAGNALKNIYPDFSIAENLLIQAETLFETIVGQKDLASERILEYIREYPIPPRHFNLEGMRIDSKQGDPSVFRLSPLSGRLLEASNEDLYKAFVTNTQWEKLFTLEWLKDGETVIKQGDYFDGIYHIVRGSVSICDPDGIEIAVLSEGDIFGEIAAFSPIGKRTASVCSCSELAIRKISNENFQKLPEIVKDAFRKIALNRLDRK